MLLEDTIKIALKCYVISFCFSCVFEETTIFRDSDTDLSPELGRLAQTHAQVPAI